jgi:UDP-N-acetylglucosamine 2-epimerase (non-hydrolysing)
MVVIGTRPEAIKMAPVIRAIGQSGWLSTRVVATAQHRHLLDQVLEQFDIRADRDLDLMTDGQTLSAITSRCVAALESVIASERPDIVIAQGDTTTTFASALVAFYNRIPFAHVEAGLRTYDLQNPFPEEFNRQAASKLAAFHFAPTEIARECLLAEGVSDELISVTGNTVIDALLMKAGTQSARNKDGPVRNMLLTIHRRENFGQPLQNVGKALKRLLELEPELQVIWPVHPNPNVHGYAHSEFGNHPQVRLSPPLDYGQFVQAMVDADFILSDSGGVQEEAPALARPVLVLRECTERPEAVRAGVAKLVGTDFEAIQSSVRALMHDDTFYAGMAKGVSPYGDGRASARIVDGLAQLLGRNS